ncbi:restriction endonuclease subunit S [Streptomyces sp. NPDC046821]|uniref:restriction endonuclease subunit S n=1 Tax=Streptomyces sp. NPDC046821 TaxID=3154702 RepID=UPI0033F54F23
MKRTFKQTDVPWIGAVPEHWEVKRLKFSISSTQTGFWGSEPTGGEDDVLCVRVADFDRPRLKVSDEIPTVRSVKKSDQVHRILKQGDLLLEKSGGTAVNPVGFVGIFEGAKSPAISSNFLTRLRLAKGQHPQYWLYAHAASYVTRLTARSVKQTTGIQNLDQDSYFDELFPFPPYEEQVAIADYLDRETAQIDTLIDEQRRLVTLLRERRNAVRTNIATKGTRETSPTRESGLFWAGELPEHWKVVPLISVARLESGHTPSRSRSELWENCDIPWISLNDVSKLSDQEFISDTTNLISESGIAASSARILPAGTVVLSRDATVGRSSIMAIPMATSQHFADWVCGPEIDPRYLWLLFTSAMQPYFDSLTNGSTIRTIGMGHLKSFKVPLPPMVEQREIVDLATRETGQIDTLISESERLIELSQERRSALVTAAVTGQLDVRREG